MHARLAEHFRRALPAGIVHASLRYVRDEHQHVSCRQDVVQPLTSGRDEGAMITVVTRGGHGYAATSDLSASAIALAVARAHEWAERTASLGVLSFDEVRWPKAAGRHASRVERSLPSVGERVDLVKSECARLKTDARIVDWEAAIDVTRAESVLIGSEGEIAEQTASLVTPHLAATAFDGDDAQTRTLGGRGYCLQGGAEALDKSGFTSMAPRIAAEALELLLAPNCPSGRMHLLLAADQMMLQIHESIGHPLEMDRILGDERNFAGTSFVTPEMFGSYRYGSDLLDVSFDPTRAEEFASYRYDDEGREAERVLLIEKGILLRPLGGSVSEARSGLPGVANARAQSWNRPPIDRMANLNIEPGASTLEQMIARVERGVLMMTNCSWSIDDSRNKFQFGCERALLIEEGRLGAVVKKPNYRGISATFWRSLEAVGDASTVEVLGTPFCGKGEPNQIIRVGHASPACLFRDVEVFGGES